MNTQKLQDGQTLKPLKQVNKSDYFLEWYPDDIACYAESLFSKLL